MRILTSALLAFAVASCGGDALNGNWTGSGTLTTPVSDVNYTATATFASATHTFNVELDLPAPVSGNIIITGTYEEDGANLKLSNPTLSTTAGTLDTTSPKGYVCLTLLGADICFDSPQTSAYTVKGNTLTISVTYGFNESGTVSESKTPASVVFTKK